MFAVSLVFMSILNYNWKQKYSGMEVDQALSIHILKAVNAKKW
jgi:hypothetical protein